MSIWQRGPFNYDRQRPVKVVGDFTNGDNNNELPPGSVN
jgi:hypothetical protein